MNFVYSFLNVMMEKCYNLCNNYGLAIILFTIFTKFLLLPLSMWTYFEGIKMIKIQPDISYIKVRYYGQPDQIAEEQAKLFKDNKYSPMVSVVPTVVQLILLIGVVGVIKIGIENSTIDMRFGPVNLGDVPSEVGVGLLWSPIVAGVAAFLLCIAQNASNVLQSEQSKLNKYGMTILSVGLSLYLGWFVAVGTAFYWVLSNLFAVLQLYIFNWIIKPKKYIDYDRLEDSRKQLAELRRVGCKKHESFFSENKKRERTDYKRFFSIVNKHLVFYSEANGFFKYYKGFIDYILIHTNLTIHYITSDPNDNIFELAKHNPRIRGYYIGENKLITLMMKMDADVVCMTMPDLENYHIKRSYVREDVKYIYMAHGIGSNNLTLRRGSTDHYDAVFVTGIHQYQEEKEIEKLYNLKQREIITVGYPLMDEMIDCYKKEAHSSDKRKKILIAPSWQKDNIIDSCLDRVLEVLSRTEYEIIVRPHPQEMRHKKEYIDGLKNKYENENIKFQTDFSLNDSIFDADVLITDWSDISWEFAFTTKRPVLFVDTPMKVMNPEYKKISIVPINILLRNQIGIAIQLDQIDSIDFKIKELLLHAKEYEEKICIAMKKYVYNIGSSAEVGGEYIVKEIQKKIRERENK